MSRACCQLNVLRSNLLCLGKIWKWKLVPHQLKGYCMSKRLASKLKVMKLFLIDMERCLSMSCLQLVSESCTKKLWWVSFVFLFSKSFFRGFGSVMYITSLFSRLDHYTVPFEMHVVCNWLSPRLRLEGSGWWTPQRFHVQVDPWQEHGNTIIQEKYTHSFSCGW